jgi:hypothetical protein
MRGFYVRTYRWMKSILVICSAITPVLSIVIFFLYLTQGESSFYATSGELLPIKLDPMMHANESSTPLLANEQPSTQRKRSVSDI